MDLRDHLLANPSDGQSVELVWQLQAGFPKLETTTADVHTDIVITHRVSIGVHSCRAGGDCIQLDFGSSTAISRQWRTRAIGTHEQWANGAPGCGYGQPRCTSGEHHGPGGLNAGTQTERSLSYPRTVYFAGLLETEGDSCGQRAAQNAAGPRSRFYGPLELLVDARDSAFGAKWR